MTFEVEITETLQRTVCIEATTKIEALKIAARMYDDEEIVLDSNDLTHVKMEADECNE